MGIKTINFDICTALIPFSHSFTWPVSLFYFYVLAYATNIKTNSNNSHLSNERANEQANNPRLPIFFPVRMLIWHFCWIHPSITCVIIYASIETVKRKCSSFEAQKDKLVTIERPTPSVKPSIMNIQVYSYTINWFFFLLS